MIPSPLMTMCRGEFMALIRSDSAPFRASIFCYCPHPDFLTPFLTETAMELARAFNMSNERAARGDTSGKIGKSALK
jgi:hypothetical protein